MYQTPSSTWYWGYKSAVLWVSSSSPYSSLPAYIMWLKSTILPYLIILHFLDVRLLADISHIAYSQDRPGESNASISLSREFVNDSRGGLRFFRAPSASSRSSYNTKTGQKPATILSTRIPSNWAIGPCGDWYKIMFWRHFCGEA